MSCWNLMCSAGAHGPPITHLFPWFLRYGNGFLEERQRARKFEKRHLLMFLVNGVNQLCLTRHGQRKRKLLILAKFVLILLLHHLAYDVLKCTRVHNCAFNERKPYNAGLKILYCSSIWALILFFFVWVSQTENCLSLGALLERLRWRLKCLPTNIALCGRPIIRSGPRNVFFFLHTGSIRNKNIRLTFFL